MVKMGVNQVIVNSLKVLIGGTAFLAIFCTVIELMFFLSDPNYNRKSTISKDVWLSVSWSMMVNMGLLGLFMLPHTFLAVPAIKNLFSKYNAQDLCRSFYIIATAISLQIMMRYWLDIPEVALWKFNMNFRIFWWLYSALHIISWLVIYTATICMDVNELIGIKQIYYSIRNLPDPNSLKSFQLRRLYSHMRHPSFCAFTIIFWVLPVMSLDRLLLATILTIYMCIAWNPDQEDYGYQYTQYMAKFYEFNPLRS